jgi:integrase/recombinase XerD
VSRTWTSSGIASYRDAFRLLLRFVQERLGKTPSSLALDDLDAALVSAFLDHVEQHRRNTPRTRNVRLAAIHAFCHYVASSEPAHLDRCRRILAIPVKRHERRPIAYLTRAEIDALLAAPDVGTWSGRRDRALILLAIQTGLRVSELIHLRCGDIVLGTGAHPRCEGKGRKQRCTPLQRDMVGLLTAWLRERNGQPSDPLFPTARGIRLSRDAVERLVARHIQTAQARCPSLKRKRVSPHVLRHYLPFLTMSGGVGQQRMPVGRCW